MIYELKDGIYVPKIAVFRDPVKRPEGRVYMYLRDETGYNVKVKFDGWLGTNLVVDVGLYHIADQLTDQSDAAMSHMAIGNQVSPSPPAAGNTALESELDRNALTSKTHGAGSDAKKVTYVGDWPPGDGTGTLTEAGIFNAASGGIMLARKTYDARPKGGSDTLTITWEVTFS
jgi:hypothetical protein